MRPSALNTSISFRVGPIVRQTPFVWADASLRSLSPGRSHTKPFVQAFWVSPLWGRLFTRRVRQLPPPVKDSAGCHGGTSLAETTLHSFLRHNKTGC
ncbi:hypothetical protein AVEN_198008-1 [Araneus ventricosus]|uniref:Uncharacterized protein n=1 Tax=Araneus ventricosus TaxID=182803 RepID=A0A4Y2U323_ARAVE|nr:hypothetical protein AVEN_198008-1 [Araneus ventricosus]